MRWCSWVIPAVVLAAWGCGPPEMVPVLPPGLEYREVVPETIPEGEAAEALGEARGSLAGASQGAAAELPAAEPTEVGAPRTTETGLTYETLQPGTGDVAKAGQAVTVQYTGTLQDGLVFDTSRDDPQPFTFTLGLGQVISGWEQGVAGMRVGERRKLTIPPELAYGASSPKPEIPPNSTLIFDVELLKVE